VKRNTAKLMRVALLLGLALVMAYAGLKTWRRIEPSMLESRLVAAARPGDISMLSSVTCADCVVARNLLDRLKVPYAECAVEVDAQCAARFKAIKAIGTPTFIVRGEPQAGLNLKRMVAALEAGR
jgi:glutaredoxin